MSNNELTLKKTHDHSAVKNPKLVAVLIHGIASDSSTFEHALEYLESQSSLKDVRFVTFDLLGSGKSIRDENLNYGYTDQLEALHNAIEKLNIGETPLVLVGHSMGTLIVTRYADTYKKSVSQLILVSPPIYTEKDLNNPAFAAGMKLFQEAVSVRNRKILEEKSFKNSISKIVLNRRNYSVLADIKTPAVLIYGNIDQFIGAYNIPRIVKENSNLTAIKTEGRHGVTRDKYTIIAKVLEEVLHV